jgi:hypothetical protein
VQVLLGLPNPCIRYNVGGFSNNLNSFDGLIMPCGPSESVFVEFSIKMSNEDGLA